MSARYGMLRNDPCKLIGQANKEIEAIPIYTFGRGAPGRAATAPRKKSERPMIFGARASLNYRTHYRVHPRNTEQQHLYHGLGNVFKPV